MELLALPGPKDNYCKYTRFVVVGGTKLCRFTTVDESSVAARFRFAIIIQATSLVV